MPRGQPSNINAFPSVYIELVTTVWSGQTIRIPYKDLKAARAARCRFYDFKKLLRRQTEEHLQILCTQAEGVQVTIIDTTLVYTQRDASEEAAIIAAALQKAGHIPGHSPDEVEREIENLLNATNPIAINPQEAVLSQFLSNESPKKVDS